MTDTDLSGEVDPEDRMTELDALQSERLDEALDNERETGHDGTDDVVDEDVDSMMVYL